MHAGFLQNKTLSAFTYISRVPSSSILGLLHSQCILKSWFLAFLLLWRKKNATILEHSIGANLNHSHFIYLKNLLFYLKWVLWFSVYNCEAKERGPWIRTGRERGEREGRDRGTHTEDPWIQSRLKSEQEFQTNHTEILQSAEHTVNQKSFPSHPSITKWTRWSQEAHK